MNQFSKRMSFIGILLCCFTLSSNAPETHQEKKLRVLVATNTFPHLAQRYVVNQIVGLLNDGHEVALYAQSKGNTDKVHEDVVTYDLMSKLHVKSLPEDIQDYDIILCQHGNVGNKLLALRKKYKLRAKLVTFFRGFEIWGLADRHPNLYKELFKKGDFFLTNCKAFAKRVIYLGCSPDKILVNYSSINLEDIPYQERQPKFDTTIRILTTGRLIAKKGISDVISALTLLIKKYPHIRYTIAGEGPLRKKLIKQAKKLGIRKYIRFYGGYQSEELPQLLEDADIFVAPSVRAKGNDRDALTNTIKEAMASGLPIVSTYHGGIPEFIKHEENGLLVKEHDVKDLARQIEKLITNPHLANKFGKKGRLLVENNFERSWLNRQLIEYLKRVIRIDI